MVSYRFVGEYDEALTMYERGQDVAYSADDVHDKENGHCRDEERASPSSGDSGEKHSLLSPRSETMSRAQIRRQCQCGVARVTLRIGNIQRGRGTSCVRMCNYVRSVFRQLGLMLLKYR